QKKRAVRLWSKEPKGNQQLTDKTTHPHRNCETVDRANAININHLRDRLSGPTETVKLWISASSVPNSASSAGSGCDETSLDSRTSLLNRRGFSIPRRI